MTWENILIINLSNEKTIEWYTVERWGNVKGNSGRCTYNAWLLKTVYCFTTKIENKVFAPRKVKSDYPRGENIQLETLLFYLI